MTFFKRATTSALAQALLVVACAASLESESLA
jgi:hypothetical protein